MTPALGQHVYITGNVQGVGYRYSLVRQAQALNVSGWCRNLADGRVEAVFQGPAHCVDQLTEWCRQGPPLARVTEVLTLPLEAPFEGTGFEVHP